MIAVTTLDEFIIDKQDDFPFAGGDLSRLLRDIGFASKIVNREVNNSTNSALVKLRFDDVV